MASPKLRFKEFDGKWSLTSLNQLSTKIGDGIHATPKYDENGIIPFINGNNLVNGKILINENTKRISAEEFQKYNQILSDRTLFLSINGTIGNLAFYKNEKVLLGKSVCFINLKDDIDDKFVYLLLQSPQLTKTFNSELTGTTIKNLSLATVRNSEFYCPSVAEQTKIASFLSAVDEKISLLTKKHELLSQYKQGMMQKLFSQQIRFKADDGSEFGEWETLKFKDLINIKYGKDHKKLGDGNIPVLGTGGIMRYVDSYLYDGESILIGRKGTINKPQFISGKFWTVDTLFYTEIGKKILPKFAFQQLLLVNWLNLNEATGVPSLNTSSIGNIEIKVPCLDEQTKIANFLSAIDQKIEVVVKQIEQAKQWKKGLLQQMFV
ncbi:restriction endonuclease subunit S [Acinetobacter baumannii]|nr:restriction endonuclease subunit S [Acinetobacter baumannii]